MAMTAVRGRMADNTTNLPIHLVAAARVTRSGSAEPEAGYGLLGSAWSVGSIACTDRGEPICARQRNPRATGLSSVPAGPAVARARQFGRASIAPNCAAGSSVILRAPSLLLLGTVRRRILGEVQEAGWLDDRTAMRRSSRRVSHAIFSRDACASSASPASISHFLAAVMAHSSGAAPPAFAVSRSVWYGHLRSGNADGGMNCYTRGLAGRRRWRFS